MDVLGQVLLEQGSTNLVCKGPDSEYTVFCLAGYMVFVPPTLHPRLSLVCVTSPWLQAGFFEWVSSFPL